MAQAQVDIVARGKDDGATAVLNRVAAAQNNVASASKNAGTAAQRAGNQAKSAWSNAGSGALQLSYIVDDMQYGFRGVVNNIPALVNGLGLGAGVAGAAGIAAVALGKLLEESQKADQTFKKTMDGAAEGYNKVADAVKKKADAVVESLKKEAAATEEVLNLEKEREEIRIRGAALGADRKKPEGAAKIYEESQKLAKVELDKTWQEQNRKLDQASAAASRAAQEEDRLKKQVAALAEQEQEAQKVAAEARKKERETSVWTAIGYTIGAPAGTEQQAIQAWAEWSQTDDDTKTAEDVAKARKATLEEAQKRAAAASDLTREKRQDLENTVRTATAEKQTAKERYEFEMQKAAVENNTLLKSIKEHLFQTMFDPIAEE